MLVIGKGLWCRQVFHVAGVALRRAVAVAAHRHPLAALVDAGNNEALGFVAFANIQAGARVQQRAAGGHNNRRFHVQRLLGGEILVMFQAGILLVHLGLEPGRALRLFVLDGGIAALDLLELDEALGGVGRLAGDQPFFFGLVVRLERLARLVRVGRQHDHHFVAADAALLVQVLNLAAAIPDHVLPILLGKDGLQAVAVKAAFRQVRVNPDTLVGVPLAQAAAVALLHRSGLPREVQVMNVRRAFLQVQALAHRRRVADDDL